MLGRLLGWLGATAAMTAAVVSGLALAPSPTGPPRSAVYVVVPHPDDEFQVWSLIEQYTVFVVLTHGEQTEYCEPSEYETSAQPDLEHPADPLPTGRWSPACSEARQNSLLRYLGDMSATDARIPGDFAPPVRTAPLPLTDGPVCRSDGADECTSADSTAEVFVDRRNRGAVVFFDLGDGDLTEDEAVWGIRTALDQRAALGLDTSLPVSAVLGAYADDDGGTGGSSGQRCFPYAHPDHLALHRALWNVDFHAGLQAAATCADDPHRSIAATVSDAAVDAAFRIGEGGERLGAHVKNYGWLWPDYYHVAREGELDLFTQQQYFWVRFDE
jgi:hypothetical protein